MKLWIELLADMLLVVLALDLLYLYFAGGWTDPNPVILTAELAVLPLIVVFGIWKGYRSCKG